MAHPLPPAVRTALHERLRPYRRAHPGARWTRSSTWHLTLLFLGSVRPGRIPELTTLIAGVADATTPYDVSLGRGGGRSRHGDGVAWLALTEGAGTLIEAAQALAEQCPADITGGGAPKRTPSAHLTVARRADTGVIEALAAGTHGPLDVSWTVDRIDLVRSHLERAGARYQTLHRASL